MDIAIVGMAGRFPGADHIDRFWSNLLAGVESLDRIDTERLLAEGVDEELIADPDYVPVAAVLDGHDLFDARFFGFGAREAALLDPQHRVFLECAWHAMDDAGIPPSTVGTGGVFSAANMPGYLLSNLLSGRRAILDGEFFALQIHNDKDYLATRVAHCLGFTGPAVSVQTACSGSLVAVHEAAQALATGRCDLALAGGVCVRVPHHVGYRHEPGMVFSVDGHCRPFDADASGTVFGNGVGAVVLRRLDDALSDGNRVLAVLRGSAVNNDGSAKVGFTAPSVTGQQAVVRAAIDAAGISAATITAVEAHGTGTLVGDPIEITALTRAFATERTGFCTVGSVKANIGHLESAAGIAGFIKAVLQLRHGVLPPTPHFRTPNPAIEFTETPFVVRREPADWTTDVAPRRIGVSAFGIGGTNAHAVLEQAPEQKRTPPATQPHLLVLSGKTRDAVGQVCTELAGALTQRSAPRVRDAARTLRDGRERFRFRRAVVVHPKSDGTAAEVTPLTSSGAAARAGDVHPVWLLPGQGSQYPGMCAGLYHALPEYAAIVDDCAARLSGQLGVDLREALLCDRFPPDQLRATEVAQPALFVAEYALAEQLRHWGCTPSSMVGHSLGEIVAACLSGVLDPPDALHLAVERGALAAAQPPGVMLAVHADEDTVVGMLPGDVSLAAVNAPGLCVVAGPTEAMRRCRTRLESAGHPVTELHTSHAFHSPMMDPVVGPLREFVATMPRHAPGSPFVSTVTGASVDDRVREPDHWARHARQPVRFAEALATAANGVAEPLVIELGPGRVLSTFATAVLGPHTTVVPTMPRPGDGSRGLSVLLEAVGRMWERGCPVDLAALPDADGDLVALPGYPFARERYWIDRTDTAPAQRTTSESSRSPDVHTDRPAGLSAGYVAPETERQRRIVAVWEEILQYSPIGTQDDFFELGGHSLLATQVSARLTDVTGVPYSMRDVLARPTPGALAELGDR